MTSIMERFKKIKEKMDKETANKSSFSEGDDIWYSWTTGKDHTIRLVGDLIMTRIHWIGPSKWSAGVELYDSKNFEGDNRLPYQLNCNNWDIDTESEIKDGGCVICELKSILNKLIYSDEGKALPEKELNYFKDLRNKCDAKTRSFFNVLDRENPYINVDEKTLGYKVMEAPWELLDGIINISTQVKGIDLLGVEKGIDLKVTRSGGGKSKVSYSVQPVFEGLSAKVTPLTDEERALTLHDLKVLKGKKHSNDELRERLNDEVKALLEPMGDVADSNKAEDNDADAPF